MNTLKLERSKKFSQVLENYGNTPDMEQALCLIRDAFHDLPRMQLFDLTTNSPMENNYEFM